MKHRWQNAKKFNSEKREWKEKEKKDEKNSEKLPRHVQYEMFRYEMMLRFDCCLVALSFLLAGWKDSNSFTLFFISYTKNC